MIEFGYEKKNEFLEFFIRDNGIGIPKDKQEEIFNRFIQADISDKRTLQGAGLGLAITKSYLEMIGGKIWLESEPGLGSTFFFTLPYNPMNQKENPTVVGIQKEIDEVQNKNLKILIAEDDQTSEMLLTAILKKKYVKIHHAKTGLEAIEFCRNNPDIGLILMDIRMPKMNGYEATRQIREFNNQVVIFAQTAYAQIGDREKALEAGCNDYITKPISGQKLLSLIQRHFNNQ